MSAMPEIKGVPTSQARDNSVIALERICEIFIKEADNFSARINHAVNNGGLQQVRHAFTFRDSEKGGKL